MPPDLHRHRETTSRCADAVGLPRPGGAADLMAAVLPGDVPWAVLERERAASRSGPDDDDHVPDWVRALWRAEAAGTDEPDAAEPSVREVDAVDGQDVEVRAFDAMSALSALAPGAALVRLLDRLDPDAISDALAVEAVAAAARMEAWAHATAARWSAVLAARPAMRPAWSEQAGGAPAPSCVAGDEIAMRLAVPRRTGAGLVTEGLAFAGVLQATGEALAEGRIDAARARVLVGRLTPLPAQVALAVEDRVLPEAANRTAAQVRRDVERALVEVDGAEAETRHVRARRGRRVDHARLLPDGMAGLWCVLPAADAVRMDGVLDAAARTARTCGDPRTLDQLRVDGLRDLVLAGAGAPAPDPAVQVRVTVPLSTLIGLDDGPGDVAGFGPVDALQARALAAGGVWRRLVTDPLSGAVLDVGRRRYRPPAALVEHVRARDRRCARPGCEVDAGRSDLDHTVEFHGRPGAGRGTQVDPTGPRGGEVDPPRGTTSIDDTGRTGVGDTGRTGVGGTGTTGVGDTGTTGVGDLGTTGVGDLGRTSVDNLGPLCRRDHRLKTDGGFVLRQPQPGVFEWTTPAGLRYRVRPGDDRGYRRLAPVDDPALRRTAGSWSGSDRHGSSARRHGPGPGGPGTVRSTDGGAPPF
jgi:hypothetical protein